MVYLSMDATVPRRPVTLPSQATVTSAPTSERLVGFTAPYHVQARDDRGDAFMFARGCFEGSLTFLQCYVNHDTSMRLGCSKDRSLRVFDRPDGLHFSLALSSAHLSEQKAEQLKRYARERAFTGASPGWIVRQQHYSTALRAWLVTRAELYEISVLTGRERPRFAGTWVRFDRAAA